MSSAVARPLGWLRALVRELWLPAALITWWALGSAHSHSPYYPPLSQIWDHFRHTWFGPGFRADAVPSLRNLAIGLAIAVVLGVAVGLCLALSPLLGAIADPFVQFARAIPSLAVLPALFVILGFGASGKVVAIAFGAIWPVLLNTLDGIHSIDPQLRITARSYRLPTHLVITKVLLPGAFPQIAVGIRTSLSIGVILMVGSEMFAATSGLGHFVIVSQQTFASADMWSGILFLGCIGYVLNLGYGLVERRMLRSRPPLSGAR
jgi:ABC-type nitrate/sulfonate/bicarbonate transport system permease component